jgi:hypothetical protein
MQTESLHKLSGDLIGVHVFDVPPLERVDKGAVPEKGD